MIDWVTILSFWGFGLFSGALALAVRFVGFGQVFNLSFFPSPWNAAKTSSTPHPQVSTGYHQSSVFEYVTEVLPPIPKISHQKPCIKSLHPKSIQIVLWGCLQIRDPQNQDPLYWNRARRHITASGNMARNRMESVITCKPFTGKTLFGGNLDPPWNSIGGAGHPHSVLQNAFSL